MMYYYKTGEACCISRQPLEGMTVVSQQEASEATQYYYFSHRQGQHKTACCINHPAWLADRPEGLWCLDTRQMDAMVKEEPALPAWLCESIAVGAVTAVTDRDYLDRLLSQQDAREPWQRKSKKRVHILAMGDVGGTLLMGLSLLGGDCISDIGIYDFNENLCLRWEHELNQIAYPWQYDRLPAVHVLRQEQLFDCDVFLFCASKGIPPVGEQVADVRMIQLEANSQIIAQYGKMAREVGFQGLFAVVSDPVDPLCQRVWMASNCDETGQWDGNGLRPEQVQGYGLGVMNSRAAYYAKQEERFSRFLTEGRAYGPHGQQLVIADSIEHYDHQCSMELTQKTVEANLEVRALGFKPYIAPAISSAAISVLLTLRGDWHYSSNFLGGIFMGSKNRTGHHGLEIEHLPLPQQLLERLQLVVDTLEAVAIGPIQTQGQ